MRHKHQGILISLLSFATAAPLAVACSSSPLEGEGESTNALVSTGCVNPIICGGGLLGGELRRVPTPGDIDGDGKADVALTSGISVCSTTPWQSLPVAFSNGDGSFRVTNGAADQFPTWATTGGAVPVMGDFDGDGKADIALTDGTGFTSIPVAFSNGDGTFHATNSVVANFPAWTTEYPAHTVAGDFDGDGREDLAVVGGPGWTSIPLALSNGDGTFRVMNEELDDFPGWASSGFPQVVAGDFDGDGKSDIALVGGQTPLGNNEYTPWQSIPVAFSNGDGTFRVANQVLSELNFPSLALLATAMVGDFDGDRRADIALASGYPTWQSVPIAFSNGDGSFHVTNAFSNFPSIAAGGYQVQAADVDGDNRTDLMLTGGAGWSSIPVWFSNGDGSFHMTNDFVSNFPVWAQSWGFETDNTEAKLKKPNAVSASYGRVAFSNQHTVVCLPAPTPKPTPTMTPPPAPTPTAKPPPPPCPGGPSCPCTNVGTTDVCKAGLVCALTGVPSAVCLPCGGYSMICCASNPQCASGSTCQFSPAQNTFTCL